MAFSKVQICNVSLGRVGISQPIASLAESSNEAIQCNAFYDFCVDQVLRDLNWPFARKYAALALVDGAADDPVNDDWTYAYRYPADCVAVRRIVTSAGRNDTKPPPFAIGNDASGRLVYTDQELAVVEYTLRITDPTLYDPVFGSCLAWLLGAEIAMPLAAGASGRTADGMRRTCLGMYIADLSRAGALAKNEEQRDEQPDAEAIRARA